MHMIYSQLKFSLIVAFNNGMKTKVVHLANSMCDSLNRAPWCKLRIQSLDGPHVALNSNTVSLLTNYNNTTKLMV